MTGAGDLVVVVPRRFDQRHIPAIVESKAAWIERARGRVEARRAAAAAALAGEPSLPESISLPALGEAWSVEYRAGSSDRAVAREGAGGRLVVTAPAGDEEAARRALVNWLKRRAAEALPERLEVLGRHHGLRFAAVSVRNQRSRWGSCSPRGNISLNLRLLFLEPEVVDYVLLHELCHTRELNHGPRFWALLRSLDRDWAVHRRRAREVWRTLPGWVRAEDGAAGL